jgi:3-oxo-5-alpha-steroid 4-dehydrogenase 1
MSLPFFNTLVYIWIAIALLIFPFVLKIVAPYGRHTTNTWGPLISNRLGWIIMESPALLLFSGLFLSGSAGHTPVTWIFFGFWVLHYVNRTLIFPFRIRTKGKKMPVTIVLMAFCFNLVNGFLNGYYLGCLGTGYNNAWFYHPAFIIGLLFCIYGLARNWQSDNILIHLRKPGETGYKIPKGGLFDLVSCPNHFSEIIEWTGFALMTWSLPGLSFAAWTFVNLLPRALHHHQWYKATFPDYPKERKSVIPYIL